MKDEQLKPFIGHLVEITEFDGNKVNGVLRYDDTSVYRSHPYYLDPHSTYNRPRYKKSHIKKIKEIQNE